MAARVMLLLLAVGVFVAIWSGDRRAEVRPATPFAQTALQSPKAEGVAVAERSRPRPMVASRERTPGRDRERTPGFPKIPGSCETPATAVSHAAVPLPGGITPGEYRIVRSDGRVLELRLTPAELARRGIPRTEQPRSFYLLHDGRIRWYFIRVETARTQIVNRAGNPRIARDTLRSWWSRVRQVETPMIGQLRSAWDALRTGALQAIAESARCSRNAFAVAIERLREAAVRMRRVAAEPRPTRR
jgi:hypothetical protein